MRIDKSLRFARRWLVPPGIYDLLKNVKQGKCRRPGNLTREEIVLLEENQLLKDRHLGSRCFILGAGPSIREQDISKLQGEYVISVSNTFVHPEFSRIRPRYHALPPLIKNHGVLHSEEKFMGWLRAMEIRTVNAEMFMHIGDRELVERNGLFRNRTIHWVEYQSEWDESFDTPVDLTCIPSIWSVSELALTAALYLGFDKIYLLGIDHDWFNGVLVYFYDHTKDHSLRPDEKDLAFIDSEFQMRRHSKIFRKYKYLYSIKNNIYNANADPDHYMDTFPKVEFDTLFSQHAA